MKLEKALELASYLHKNQFRKDYVPFIEHPKAVVKMLKDIGFEDEISLCAAYLHDTVEDCNIDFETLTNLLEDKKCFNDKEIEKIIIIVQKLTCFKNDDPYYKYRYLSDIANSADSNDICMDTFIIKLCDRFHNVKDKIKLDIKNGTIGNAKKYFLKAIPLFAKLFKMYENRYVNAKYTDILNNLVLIHNELYNELNIKKGDVN